MPRSFRSLALLGLALFALPAGATLYTGSPKLKLRVDRPQGDYVDGVATVDEVVVYPCGGGSTTYVVDATVDPVVGFIVPIDPGDLCSAEVVWGSSITIDGPAYTVATNPGTTTLVLDEDIPEVLLSPCAVTEGTMSGGCPRLYAWVD